MPNNVGNSPFWFGYSLDFWNSVSSKLLAFAVLTGILAAVASGLSSWIGSAVTSRIQDAAGNRIGAAELELQKSRERTSALDAAVADANARAAEANRIAEHERLARIKIEERLAELTLPRHIDFGAVTKAAGAFPGMNFDVSLVMGDPEAEALATQIEEAFLIAGWKEVDWRGGSVTITRPNKPTWSLNNSFGSAMLVDTRQAELAALAVLTALKLTIKDAEVNSTVGAPPEYGTPGAVHLVIGKKRIKPE